VELTEHLRYVRMARGVDCSYRWFFSVSGPRKKLVAEHLEGFLIVEEFRIISINQTLESEYDTIILQEIVDRELSIREYVRMSVCHKLSRNLGVWRVRLNYVYAITACQFFLVII